MNNLDCLLQEIATPWEGEKVQEEDAGHKGQGSCLLLLNSNASSVRPEPSITLQSPLTTHRKSDSGHRSSTAQPSVATLSSPLLRPPVSTAAGYRRHHRHWLPSPLPPNISAVLANREGLGSGGRLGARSGRRDDGGGRIRHRDDEGGWIRHYDNGLGRICRCNDVGDQICRRDDDATATGSREGRKRWIGPPEGRDPSLALSLCAVPQPSVEESERVARRHSATATLRAVRRQLHVVIFNLFCLKINYRWQLAYHSCQQNSLIVGGCRSRAYFRYGPSWSSTLTDVPMGQVLSAPTPPDTGRDVGTLLSVPSACWPVTDRSSPIDAHQSDGASRGGGKAVRLRGRTEGLFLSILRTPGPISPTAVLVWLPPAKIIFSDGSLKPSASENISSLAVGHRQ
uniref:p0028E10.6 protein n=1 Tax=Oryza sativa subsp. japonica TaxID=39947 RepID=Q9AS86_ORYSJ|nr:P0028E10.6 [Oryza sativa Japonica Group]